MTEEFDIEAEAEVLFDRFAGEFRDKYIRPSIDPTVVTELLAWVKPRYIEAIRRWTGPVSFRDPQDLIQQMEQRFESAAGYILMELMLARMELVQRDLGDE